jgi:hypothetical protein
MLGLEVPPALSARADEERDKDIVGIESVQLSVSELKATAKFFIVLLIILSRVLHDIFSLALQMQPTVL